MKSTRRLAAIMFTDIVGYTALMGKDEEKALALLKRNIHIQRPLIARFNGNLLKEMGDGVLASFPTVSDAVYCAGAIQNACKAEEDLFLRIGIHQGEVVFEGYDVFGDGVNIASRIEALAPSGAIWVSESVHKNVVNKKGIETTFVKEAQLKNVSEPVRIYEAKVEEVVAPVSAKSRDSSKTNQRKILLTLTAVFAVLAIIYLGNNYLISMPGANVETIEKSIAVRAFWNESLEEGNEYFVNGMTEDIRNRLAQISDLRVISRGSMEKYRETDLSTNAIANEMKVSYVLEGTAQKLGNQLKIHAQLIRAEDDNHIWQATYERDLSQIDEVFKVQSNIALEVASAIKAFLTPKEEQLMDEIPTKNRAAYEYYLRGEEQRWNVNTIESDHLAMDYYRKAIDEDSKFATAYAALALTMSAQSTTFGREFSWLADSAWGVVTQALDINIDDPTILETQYTLLVFMGKYKKAEQVLLELVALNGINNERYTNRKFTLSQLQGEIDSMMKWALKWEGIRLQDDKEGFKYTYLLIYTLIGDFSKMKFYSKYVQKSWELSVLISAALAEKDITLAKKYVEELIPINSYRGLKQAGYIALIEEDYLRAASYLEEALDSFPANEIPILFGRSIHTILAFVYIQQGEVLKAQRLLKTIRESDVLQIIRGDGSSKYPYDLASGYAAEGKVEESMRWLEEARNKGLNQYWIIEDDPVFDSVRDDRAYKRIIGEMQIYIERMRIKVRLMEKERERLIDSRN